MADLFITFAHVSRGYSKISHSVGTAFYIFFFLLLFIWYVLLLLSVLRHIHEPKCNATTLAMRSHILSV